MGRDVKIRVNYQTDAGFLTRLARAIEQDPRRSAAWKAKAMTHISALVALFLEDAAAGFKRKAE